MNVLLHVEMKFGLAFSQVRSSSTHVSRRLRDATVVTKSPGPALRH